MSRLPWLTLLVFVVTTATTATMYARPELGLGTALMRDPKMLTGEWWRFVTAWLVNTDGWAQVVINSIGLLVYGTLVERILGRWWWIAGYVVAGLAGEVAGVWWQPLGGGNSVAICGLIGLISVWQAARADLPGAPRVLGVVIWGGLGLWLLVQSDIHGAALLAGFAMGGIAWLSMRRREATW